MPATFPLRSNALVVEPSIVLFDGVCNLCNHAVDFIVRRDSSGRFCFASLTSDIGRELQKLHNIASSDELDSIVLIEGKVSYVRSAAALRIARHLDGLWPLLFGLMLIPAPIRDAAYRGIARNRYRWFGTRDSCRVPTEAERGRFLE